MELHVLILIFVSSASISSAGRDDLSSVITTALRGTKQSMEAKAGADISQSHRVGSTIANRYILVQELENRRYGHGGPTMPNGYIEPEKLGEGGYATAYKATDTNGQDVVLKILNNDKADDRYAQKQTSDECNIMQALQTNKRVKLFPDGAKQLMRCIQNNIKLGGEGLNQFIVIEYGGIQLDKESKLSRDVASVEDRGKHIVEIVKQALLGVVYLSGLGVAHRDLKPDNILVQYDASGNAQIKIIDFGTMAQGNDVHCLGSKCHCLGSKCTSVCAVGAHGTAVCNPPSFPAPSGSCSTKWEKYVYAPPETVHPHPYPSVHHPGQDQTVHPYPYPYAPPEMRDKRQRVCLTPDYPVDAFDIWSMGMTVLQLVKGEFDTDCGVGSGVRGDAPNNWEEWFWTDKSLDSTSGKLLSEFCISALQTDYSARGRVVDLLKIFDTNFKKPDFPKLQELLIPVSSDLARQGLKRLRPVTSHDPINQPEVSVAEELVAKAALECKHARTVPAVYKKCCSTKCENTVLNAAMLWPCRKSCFSRNLP